MTEWFRSWHGAPTDPKWVLIARKAGTTPAVASAIAWALFDHASQSTPRGDVSGFDCEVYAAWGGVDDSVVLKAIEVMTERGMIVDGQLANWRKRQPEREDGSAERAKAWRERNKNNALQDRTQTNASERKRPIDTDTDTDIITDVIIKNKKKTNQKSNGEPMLIAAGVDAQTIADWKAVRRGSITETVAKGFLEKCAKANISPQKAVEKCCERGWTGFEPSWLDPQNRRTGPPKPQTVAQLAIQHLKDHHDAQRFNDTTAFEARAQGHPLGPRSMLGFDGHFASETD